MDFRMDENIFIKIRINIHNNNIKRNKEYGICCGEWLLVTVYEVLLNVLLSHFFI